MINGRSKNNCRPAAIGRTLNQCAQGSVKLVYIAGMGDWKWKREWLMETRHYGRATKKVDGDGGLICRRCLCGTADKPWVDMSERFNNEADLERAAQTSCFTHSSAFLQIELATSLNR